MKHLLSIFTVLFFINNTTNAQTINEYNVQTINGKEYIMYDVKPGDTWSKIAFKFGVTERSLIDNNKQANGSLKGVTKLKVSMVNSTKNSAQFKLKNSVVEAPVELNSLPKFGDNRVVTTSAKPTIYGQELRTEYRGANSLIIYKVGAGDNITNLASYYNCSVNTIVTKNNLVNNHLEVGKIIKIPVSSETKTNETVAIDTTIKIENLDLKQANVAPLEIVDGNEITEQSLTSNEEENTQLKANEIKLGNYIIVKKTGKLYIKHLVISGEDLNRISKINYSSNAKITSANNLKSQKINTGQILLVPTTKIILKKLTGLDYDKAEKENKKASGVETLAITEKEEKSSTNLFEKTVVAQPNSNSEKSKTTDSIVRYNWGDILIANTNILDSNAKKTAENFTKELAAKEVHANATTGETKESYTHVVQNGEKIEDIARKYKISINDIANWNSLYQNRIRVGQDLIVNIQRARKPYLAINSVNPETNKQIKNADNSSRVKYVEEKGLCLFTEDKFIGVAHKNIPVGTLLLVTSTENYKKIYIRVTSTLENNDSRVILQVDKNIAKQLAFNSELTNVYISYGMVE